MPRIVPGIDTLEQHLEHLTSDPEAYRPQGCPHCGVGGMRRHGGYERKVPRGEGMAFSLGPIPIPRFLCPQCRRTCSRLPMCLAPRRHYLWGVQEVVLIGLSVGESIRRIGQRVLPSRRTIGRWWERLKGRFDLHSLHLRSRFAELGRGVGVSAFWSGCLERMRLCEAMAWLDRDGVVVP
jgi:transposase-like protein